MIRFESQLDDGDFLRELAATEMAIPEVLARVMEMVGWEVVTYLRSHIGETRPPVRPGEPSRKAHPGGWADITGNLANAYRFELYADGEKIRWVATEQELPGPVQPIRILSSATRPRLPLELRLINDMEYAAFLEEHDGYWVLRGIDEPVTRVLRRALRAIAPDMEIR